MTIRKWIEFIQSKEIVCNAYEAGKIVANQSEWLPFSCICIIEHAVLIHAITFAIGFPKEYFFNSFIEYSLVSIYA